MKQINQNQAQKKIQEATQNQQDNQAGKVPIKKEIKLTSQTKERVDAAKAYIESIIHIFINKLKEKYQKMKISEEEKKMTWDILQQKMENLNLSAPEKELIKYDIQHKEAEQLRKKRQKIKAKDFTPIAIIGRGAFGEVRLCRDKNGEVVAIKKMKKSEMVFKNQIGHVRAERDVLAQSDQSWIVDLKCSFQDEKHLYLVMEYLPGGDFMTLLIKKDILSEEESKFYIAECILAVHSVHQLNYIHRDLKPDNILIDKDGHIKLSDFGLCKNMEIQPQVQFGSKSEDQEKQNVMLNKIEKKHPGYKRNRKLAYSTVGTPDYIAPEVFAQKGYTETVDWWSIGVILFEMMVGYPPFFSEEPSITCQKIINWKKHFAIPMEANLSPAAIDLIRRLVADPHERLGINGVAEIKAHPFFFGIDWKNIRNKKSPLIPDIQSDIDTKNFDKFDEEEPWIPPKGKQKKDRQHDINFIGYTYKKDQENERAALVSALENLELTISSQIKKKDERHHSPKTSRDQQNDEETNQQQQHQQKELAQQVFQKQYKQEDQKPSKSKFPNSNHIKALQICTQIRKKTIIYRTSDNQQSQFKSNIQKPTSSQNQQRNSNEQQQYQNFNQYFQKNQQLQSTSSKGYKVQMPGSNSTKNKFFK